MVRYVKCKVCCQFVHFFPFSLLVADQGEETCRVSQREITGAVDLLSATKRFDLDLFRLGPFRFDYSRDGRFLALGGKRGMVAAMDWMTKKLMCEVCPRLRNGK